MTGNYVEKLSQEIMRRNYHRKLSARIFHHAKMWELQGYCRTKEGGREGYRERVREIKGKRTRWRVGEREILTICGEASTDHQLGEGLG